MPATYAPTCYVWPLPHAPRGEPSSAVVDEIAEAATVLSGSGMKFAMHVQTSLVKQALGPRNPWLTVT